MSWKFVSWTFCNWTFDYWTFCILDVLYPGRSVTGRLVTGRCVTGRFVGGPSHLHEEGVLVAVELQEVVVQLGGDAFCIPAIQVTKQQQARMKPVLRIRIPDPG